MVTGWPCSWTATNGLRWVTTYAATHKAGAVIVPLDARLSGNEVGRMVAHARVGAGRRRRAGGQRPPGLAAGAAASPLARRGDRRLDRRGPRRRPLPGDAPGSRCRGTEALDADGSAYQVAVAPDDLADILFTSGTTGNPKAVAIRHANASTVPNGAPVWSGERVAARQPASPPSPG